MAPTTTELPQLQSLERRAQQRARERGEAELRQEMRQQMQQSNQRARAEATECQVCQERERSVVLQPCGHFCVGLQYAQNLNPPECPLCRQTDRQTGKESPTHTGGGGRVQRSFWLGWESGAAAGPLVVWLVTRPRGPQADRQVFVRHGG